MSGVEGRKMNEIMSETVYFLTETEEGKALMDYVDSYVYGKTAPPFIGPLTKLQYRKRKFLQSHMNYEDLLEYRNSA